MYKSFDKLIFSLLRHFELKLCLSSIHLSAEN